MKKLRFESGVHKSIEDGRVKNDLDKHEGQIL